MKTVLLAIFFASVTAQASECDNLKAKYNGLALLKSRAELFVLGADKMDAFEQNEFEIMINSVIPQERDNLIGKIDRACGRFVPVDHGEANYLHDELRRILEAK